MESKQAGGAPALMAPPAITTISEHIASDNLIWACRACNSSKHGRDMLEWMATKGDFPAVLVLRRYLKIVARHCDAEGCMETELSRAGELGLPFNVLLLPSVFPPLAELRRWVYPAES